MKYKLQNSSRLFYKKKMRLRLVFTAILLLPISLLIGQTTEFQGRVHLGPLAHVYKIVTIPNCPQTYTPIIGTSATTVTHETKYANDKTEITVKDIVNPIGLNPIIINANKILRVAMSPNSDGKANLYLDDKDKSVLYVNYWLNAENVVPAGTTIEEYYPVYNCAGVIPVMTLRATRILTADEKFYRLRVIPGSPETTMQWFLNSEQIRVLDAHGGINYYLVDKYDRNAKYVLELQNREYISYNSPSLDLGTLTIPFKYRFGFKKNGIEIKDDVTASFNIGVYGGYKLSRYSIINKAGTYTNRTLFSLRVGPFINLSTTTLDSVSTSVGKVTLAKDIKQNIAVLSTGLGLMGNIKNVQVGIFGGWDFGMGSDSGNWNYHKRFWLGFGVGYKLTDLFAPKE